MSNPQSNKKVIYKIEKWKTVRYIDIDIDEDDLKEGQDCTLCTIQSDCLFKIYQAKAIPHHIFQTSLLLQIFIFG